MKAAMKKVYGDRDPNQQAAAQESVPTSKVAPEEPKKMKLGFIALSPRDKSHHERKSLFNSETENVAKQARRVPTLMLHLQRRLKDHWHMKFLQTMNMLTTIVNLLLIL